MKHLFVILFAILALGFTVKAYSQEPSEYKNRLPVLCASPNEMIEIMMKNGFDNITPLYTGELVTKDLVEFVEFTHENAETMVVFLHPIKSCLLYTYKKEVKF